jgi:hypothetical protein
MKLHPMIRAFCLLTAISVITATAHAQAIPTRGVAQRRLPTVGAQKSGSVLVYPLYVYDVNNPKQTWTEITLTNTHRTENVMVHLHYVDGTTGNVTDRFVNQPLGTTNLSYPDVNPGARGYIIAIAVNNNGVPINFNYLIGSESVKINGQHLASLNADAYEALWNGNRPLPGYKNGDTVADLPLDGIVYSMAPRSAALNDTSAVNASNVTLLTVNRLAGELKTGGMPTSTLEFNGEVAIDNNIHPPFKVPTSSPQLHIPLNDQTLGMRNPQFSRLITDNNKGVMIFAPNGDEGISSAALRYNPNTTAVDTFFTGGHNLHYLTFAPALLKMPIVAPPGI